MSNVEKRAVVVDRDPFEKSTGQWARVLGVLKCDDISFNWARSADRIQEEAVRSWWKWNLVVCLLDHTRRHAIPLILCDNGRLADVVDTFASLSASHIRDGAFVRLEKTSSKVNAAGVELDSWDDAIRDALGDTIATLPLERVGKVFAAARCECLRMSLQGKPVTTDSVQNAVARSLPAKTKPKNGEKVRKRKRQRVEFIGKDEEQRARLIEFTRLKTCKTYSAKKLQTRAVIDSFSARTFVRRLDQFYDVHPGYMQTVARFSNGLPPWDRVFVEEWQDLDIHVRPPPPGEKMVLLQYPNANGMGYSFAVCSALELQQLISSIEYPTFSEVYREDFVLTAIPVDWDMPVSDVRGPKWYPAKWIEDIRDAADESLRKLLPALDTSRQKRHIVQCHMWISEEMKAAVSNDGGVSVEGLDKVTVHANLLLPNNVILSNYKALRMVYDEMERRFKTRSSSTTWHLDKSITKLRLPGCYKRLDDGRHVRRLVPWSNSPSSAYEALVHAKHEVPSCDGVDMAIIRSPSLQRKHEYGDGGSEISFDVAVDIVRRALSQNQQTASLELAMAARHPYIGVRKRSDGNNWCIIKGGIHRNATMYFVIGGRQKAWIHCFSDQCKAKRERSKSKPYIDLCTSSICWKDS